MPHVTVGSGTYDPLLDISLKDLVVDFYAMIDDRYARLFAHLRTWDSHTDLAVIPADGEFTDLGIGGFAAAAVEELVATAREGDTESAVDAQAALALLLRLTDRGAA